MCGCSDEITDYEDYFPDNEVVFDNDVVFDNETVETSVQSKTDVKFIVVPIPVLIYDDSIVSAFENTNEASENEAIAVFNETPIEKNEKSSDIVWTSKSGKKYHNKPDCSNMKSPNEITLAEAIEKGYEPCKRCHK